MLLRMQNLEVHRDQRELAETILRAVRHIDRHAIIAGGAPRDWYLGMRANDIDIFINSGVFNSLGRVNFLYLLGKVIDAARLPVIAYEFTELGQDLSQEYASEHIHRVFQAEINGQVFQFIVCTGSTFNIVQTFSFTVSRGWCDPRHVLDGCIRISFTDGQNLQDRVLRFTETLTQRNQRYFNKIVERFPDWRLVLHTQESLVQTRSEVPIGNTTFNQSMHATSWPYGLQR